MTHVQEASAVAVCMATKTARLSYWVENTAISISIDLMLPRCFAPNCIDDQYAEVEYVLQLQYSIQAGKELRKLSIY